MPPILAILLVAPAGAVEPRWAFQASYDNVEGGDWYRGYNDDWAPYLNGSESYVMEGLAAMFRTTGDPAYLERLAWHADGVLAQRNDARGVTDWTGEESPCWRDMYYTGGPPFCWVLHSGAIIAPIVEFSRLVAASGLEGELAYDGLTFGEKAELYTQAAMETVAWHDAEWSDAGYYVIPFETRFFLGDEAGGAYPLNCSNVMGRALFRLHDVTGDPAYLEKATALATYFHDNLVTLDDGGYVWPYYGDDVIELGENISYGALNTSFAAMAHDRGVVFDDADMARFTRTLLDRIVVDDRTFTSNLNGGEPNQLNYQAEIYYWLHAAPDDPAVYTVVRNLYEQAYPAEDNTSGTRLEAWATLAEHEPLACTPLLDPESWSDDGDGWYVARTAEPTARVFPAGPCFLPLEVDAPGPVEVRVGDTVARWQATGGPMVRNVPVAAGDTTFALVHDPAAGALRVRPDLPGVPPTIASEPPLRGVAGTPIVYTPAGAGDTPIWWSLSTFPTGARIDPASGAVSWTPAADGVYRFVLRLENVYGDAEQAFDYCVGADCPADTGAPDDTGADTGGDTPDDTAGDTPSDDPIVLAPGAEPSQAGCACASLTSVGSWGGGRAPRNAPPVVLSGLVALVGLRRRR